jgi:hypothetical protein
MKAGAEFAAFERPSGFGQLTDPLSGLSSNRERKTEMPSKSRHSRESGNPPNMGPRFRGDDAVFTVDGKPVILVPTFDGVENLPLHQVGGFGGVLGLALVLDLGIGKSLLSERRPALQVCASFTLVVAAINRKNRRPMKQV